ncbi:hypothetical protein AGMMS49950_02470 [Endomicrobiia bacterium]|nr:hypothetical protein AGMMS49531_10640 [Endomicrobiia bacterium]GHT64992.1 hypothetical protein AGMMS49556_04040 [Endomicrobiia bacterium]GHT69535.1 hypothetical protein AGMMS49950_02470 [Endomicrobiia bacterium]
MFEFRVGFALSFSPTSFSTSLSVSFFTSLPISLFLSSFSFSPFSSSLPPPSPLPSSCCFGRCSCCFEGKHGENELDELDDDELGLPELFDPASDLSFELLGLMLRLLDEELLELGLE